MAGTSPRWVSRVTCEKFGMFALGACEIPPYAPGKSSGGIGEEAERLTRYATIRRETVHTSVDFMKSATRGA